MTTTYRSSASSDPDSAQTTLTRHVPSVDGYCHTCGTDGPCAPFLVSASLVYESRQLPRRLPGVSRPDLLGRRYSTPVKWFGAASSQPEGRGGD